MAEQVTEQSAAVGKALAEPTQAVTVSWVARLGVASMGLAMAGGTPIQILLPNQVQKIAPSEKFLVVALLHTLGALAAIFATPLVGALSDRTTTAWRLGRLRGRRHRWTLGMAVLAAICLGTMSAQHTVLGILIIWGLFSIFGNGQSATLSTSIPDHVPVRQRATVAGWAGMPAAVGLVFGVVLVDKVFTTVTAGYLMLAACLVLFALPFVWSTEDHPLDPSERAPLSVRELISAYKVDLRANPDFGWAWITRFLASLSIAMGTLYLLYFLRDAVHYKNPTNGVTILILIYAACVVLTAIVFGRISDRLGKRKMIVTVSGALMAMAAVLLIFIETWPAAQVAAVLFGLGYGAYLAVDQAMITQVLPAAANRGKDLGLINIAISGPVAIGSLIAAGLVSLGSYPTLYAVTAAAGVLGSILVWRIKSVP